MAHPVAGKPMRTAAKKSGFFHRGNLGMFVVMAIGPFSSPPSYRNLWENGTTAATFYVLTRHRLLNSQRIEPSRKTFNAR